VRLIVLIVAVCLLTASTAAAATTPGPPSSWPVINLDRGKAKSSRTTCTVQKRVGRAKHKPVPVACEQPPRSRVRDAGFVIVLAP
jgi:hypothetical protein